jgi:hypothetical protein
MGACQSKGRAVPPNRLTLELSGGVIPPEDYLGQSVDILDKLPTTAPPEPTRGKHSDGLDIESAYQLLEPGYTAMEDGFVRLNDGTLYIACYVGKHCLICSCSRWTYS